MSEITKNDLLWASIKRSFDWAAEQDWTGYTWEQRDEITANKTAEIYEELKAKCGFRW